MQYHFVSREEFERLRDQEKGFFVETAQFGGNLYGTSVGAVEEVGRGVAPGEGGEGEGEGKEEEDPVGRCCVLDIEMEVSLQITPHLPLFRNRLCYSFDFLQGRCYFICETRPLTTAPLSRASNK